MPAYQRGVGPAPAVMVPEAAPSPRGARHYALVVAPLVVFVVVAWLAERGLRQVVGPESAAQLAPGLAGVVGGLLAGRLARTNSAEDWEAEPDRTPGEPAAPPSATTRALWIVTAGLGFAACGLVAWVVGLGIVAVAPAEAGLTGDAWFDATSRRSIVIFALLALLVAYAVSLRLREGTARAFAIAVGLYLVTNSTQNLGLGGDVDARWLTWAVADVLTVAAACWVGDAVARWRRTSFDAARAAGAAARRD